MKISNIFSSFFGNEKKSYIPDKIDLNDPIVKTLNNISQNESIADDSDENSIESKKVNEFKDLPRYLGFSIGDEVLNVYLRKLQNLYNSDRMVLYIRSDNGYYNGGDTTGTIVPDMSKTMVHSIEWYYNELKKYQYNSAFINKYLRDEIHLYFDPYDKVIQDKIYSVVESEVSKNKMILNSDEYILCDLTRSVFDYYLDENIIKFSFDVKVKNCKRPEINGENI